MAGRITVADLAAQVEALTTLIGTLVPEQDEDTPAPRKRTSAKGASRKPAKKSSARKSAKPTPDVWVVKKGWKGVDPSPRMIGAALHYGCSAADVEGLDKFDLSKLIGKTRGIRVKVEA